MFSSLVEGRISSRTSFSRMGGERGGLSEEGSTLSVHTFQPDRSTLRHSNCSLSSLSPRLPQWPNGQNLKSGRPILDQHAGFLESMKTVRSAVFAPEGRSISEPQDLRSWMREGTENVRPRSKQLRFFTVRATLRHVTNSLSPSASCRRVCRQGSAA